MLYKCTDYYAPEWERAVAWNDPDVGIAWPLERGATPVPVGQGRRRPAAEGRGVGRLKVLVTGGGGPARPRPVASAPAGVEVTAVDLADFDLSDAQAVAEALAAIAPEVIINSAAYTAVDKAESEPDAAFAVNRDAVRWLAQAARAVRRPADPCLHRFRLRRHAQAGPTRRSDADQAARRLRRIQAGGRGRGAGARAAA